MSKRGRPPALSTMQITAAAGRVLRGDNIVNLAKEYRVTLPTLRRALDAIDVESRERFRLDEPTIAAAGERVKLGESVTKVARELGTAAPNLGEVLNRRGITSAHRSYKKNPKLNDAIVNEAARRVQAGESINALASSYGVVVETLRIALDKIGVKSRYKVGQRPPKISDEQLSRAARRVLAGESLTKVSLGIGVTPKSLKRRLDKINVFSIHPSGGRLPAIQDHRESVVVPSKHLKREITGRNKDPNSAHLPSRSLDLAREPETPPPLLSPAHKTNSLPQVGRKRKLTDEQLRIAATRLEAKETLTRIAKDNNITPSGLRSSFNGAGITIVLRAGRRPSLTDKQLLAAKDRVNAGETLGSVAPDFGMSAGGLRNALARIDVHAARRNGSKPKLSGEELDTAAARVIQSKETVKAVAVDFDMSPSGLGQALGRIGVKSEHVGGSKPRLSYEELVRAHARIQNGELPKQVALSVGLSSGQALRYSFKIVGLATTRKFVAGKYPALTAKQVEDAKRLRRQEKLTISVLATRFRVSDETMRKVLNGTYITIKARPTHILESPSISADANIDAPYLTTLIQANGYDNFPALQHASRHRIYLKLAPADYRELHRYLAQSYPDANRAHIGRCSKLNYLSLPDPDFLASTRSPRRRAPTLPTKAIKLA